MSPSETRLSSSFFAYATLLLVCCGVLFFHHLEEEHVSSNTEARVLLTAAEMNRNKTWLVPTVGGEGRWEKPPLYVWAVKLVSMLDEGEVTPLTSRIPGALAMTCLVFLAAYWAYQHFNRYPRRDGIEISSEGFALLTGLLVASSPEIFDLARAGVPDSLFAFLCFAATYCLGESFESRRSFYASRSWRQWVLAAYILVGLAMMTKGPAAFLFVLIPYVVMCWSYKLRRPDWIHLPGLALALAIGGWWFVAAVTIDRSAADVFLEELVTKRFGSGAESHRPIYFYASLALTSFFPWIFLAVAMAYRTLVGDKRTPTLVTWSCAFIIGLVWLSLVGSKRDSYFLPVAPFILLLAGDALARWNFDSRVGMLFRALIRTLRYSAIVVGLIVALIIGSDFGVGVAIFLAIVCFAMASHRRRTTYVYAVWERTVLAAALLTFVFIFFEAVYSEDYLARNAYVSRDRAFFKQINVFGPEDSQILLYGEEDSALYSYHLGRMLPLIADVDEATSEAKTAEVYLLSDEDVKELMEEPNLVPIVTKIGGSRMRTRAALFRVLPPPEDGSARPSDDDRYAAAGPLRLVAIGDAGRGDYGDQKDMAKRLRKQYDRAPYHEVLVLGNAFRGSSPLSRSDFSKSFERAYRRLIKTGVRFSGLLGDEDQEIAWAITRYPLFQMGGLRYYERTYFGALAQVFFLDAMALEEFKPGEHPQWEWLEEELGKSKARWKIVALHRPILSLSTESENSKKIAKRLLPILDRHEVDIVLWAGERWYQRVEDPDRAPVFLGTGWSGEAKSESFREDPRLKSSYSAEAGFILLEISGDQILIQAIDVDGNVVDRTSIFRE